ncbi:MAG TPA: ATP-binding protein [Syntrophales bacterium]|nr:ATP-binding protein [Syntrophales bacterium]HRV44433.1 ATP-binding protein [Smithellaceae bacterium]
MEINRIIYKGLAEEISKPFISILIGPRQVGKTFLLRQLEAQCRQKGIKVRFHNLEDPDDLRIFSGDEEQLIRQLKNTDTDLLFLDEFHYLKNATRIFKVLYDSGMKVKIIASGSSSMEIHKHLKESLAGRFRLTVMYPLSGKELRQSPDYSFEEFVRFGGLPGLIHERGAADKMALLKNVLQTYLLKDIKALIKEENIRAFNSLLYSLAQNQGQVVAVASLARDVGLSEPAIKHHLELMAQTYVCFPIDSYSRNLANELKKVKKYYLYDTGIRNCILNDYSNLNDRADKGAIIESFVALALMKQLKVNMELKFWRTRQGAEVDFILLKNRIPVPVEVKYRLSEPIVPDGMKKFLQTYIDAPFALVFSKDDLGEVTCCGKPVRFLKWQEAEEIDYLRSVE